MSIPDVEHLYQTQVQEFKARYTAMRDKMISMYSDHEGFRDAFKEIWENGFSLEDRRDMMKIVMKRVEENLPPPKNKATMLLGKSCPEFFFDELTMGKTITMTEFMDYLVAKKENSPKYPFYDKIKADLKTFLSALPVSVYPQFSGHPKEAQYTWDLLWEQRVFWVCHFALNLVAEMCSAISQFKAADEKAQVGDGEAQELQEIFTVGRRVKLDGLKREDLNGKEGSIVSYVKEKGRVGVLVDGFPKPFSLKPENLLVENAKPAKEEGDDDKEKGKEEEEKEEVKEEKKEEKADLD